MPTRIEPEKSDHLARILNAASELFLELGFERASTADIAARAKVSKRELYKHFGDKRAILSACIIKVQKEVWSEMDIQWSQAGDIRSVLLHAGNTIFKLILSDRFGNLFRIVAAESFHDPQTAKQFYRLGPGAGRQQTAKFFKKQIDNGMLLQTDPLQAADDFLDAVITARLMTSIALGNARRSAFAKDHVAHAVDIFLTYYAAKTASPAPAHIALNEPAAKAPRLKRATKPSTSEKQS
jgi:AcrR family transcriptional regulator